MGHPSGSRVIPHILVSKPPPSTISSPISPVANCPIPIIIAYSLSSEVHKSRKARRVSNRRLPTPSSLSVPLFQTLTAKAYLTPAVPVSPNSKSAPPSLRFFKVPKSLPWNSDILFPGSEDFFFGGADPDLIRFSQVNPVK